MKVVISISIAFLMISSTLKADPLVGPDSIIVSGFVLDKDLDEGLEVNITIKNASNFSIVDNIISQKESGSYYCVLKKGSYYFIIEKSGYTYFNQLHIFKGDQRRIQKDLILQALVLDELFSLEEKNNEEIVDDNSIDEEVEVPEEKIEEVFEELKSSSAYEKDLVINDDPIQIETMESTKLVSENNDDIFTSDIDSEIFNDLDELISSVDINLDQSKLSLNIKIVNGFQHLDIPVKFPRGSYAIDNDISQNLQPILNFLKSNEEVKLEIRGFSDLGFVDEQQKILAKMRAKAVKVYLTTKGIFPQRLKAIAFPTKRIERMISSRKNNRAEHLIEFRIMGNDKEEEELSYEIKKDFEKGEYIFPGDTLPIISRDEKVVANESSKDKEIKTIFQNDISANDDYTKSQEQKINSNNIEQEPIKELSNDVLTISSIDEEDPLIWESELSPIDSAVINQESSEELSTPIVADRNETQEELLDEENVISAFDKFMKEIEDVNKKIIFFDKKNAYIKPEYKQTMDSISNFLMEHPKIEIKITGYASKKEGKKKFMDLAIDRTNNVTNYLIKKGIKKTRIKAKTGGLYNKKAIEMPIEDELRVVFYVEPLKHNRPQQKKIVGAPPTLNRRKEGEPMAGVNVVSGELSENKYDQLRNEPEHIEKKNLGSESEYFNFLLEEKSDVIKQGLVYKVQVGAYNEPQPKNSRLFKKVKNPEMKQTSDGYVRYYSGSFKTLEFAYNHQMKLRKKGIKDAFVIAFLNEKRIYMRDLAKIL